MRRRAVLATAGTVALAGCTASGDDGSDADDYTVRGLEGSDVYTEAYVERLPLLDMDRLLGDGGIRIGFIYDDSAEYDPADHDVSLMDGHRVVDEGRTANPLSNDEPMIEFHLYTDDLEQTQTYRVVSEGPVEIVDEFELEVIRA